MTIRGSSQLFLALVGISGALLPTGARSGEVMGTIVAGFDSYSESYSVLQTTTVDRLAEFQTRMRVGYLEGSPLLNYLQIEAQSYIGEQS